MSLDGYLDAYFQEVYLDSDALPTFAKVAQFVSEDALDDYVDRLEEEVHKYLTRHLNYGKAAKRMYNIFRLSAGTWMPRSCASSSTSPPRSCTRCGR